MKNATHLYYGDGKGKTTAALGLALRAAGWGKKVVVVQFLKYWKTGELSSLAKLPNVTVISSKYAGGKFFNEMTEKEKQEAKSRHDEDLKKALDLYKRGECELMVLDEAVEAYQLGLLDADIFEGLLYNTPEAMELVLTGHKPEKHIIEQADYVTEMVKHKHPYDKGMAARKGIEF